MPTTTPKTRQLLEMPDRVTLSMLARMGFEICQLHRNHIFFERMSEEDKKEFRQLVKHFDMMIQKYGYDLDRHPELPGPPEPPELSEGAVEKAIAEFRAERGRR